MKAVFINNYGDVNNLNWGEVSDTETLEKNQVLVKMQASSINHLDIWVRKGAVGHTAQMPFILGSDGAGVIAEKGKSVNNYKIGDDVIIQPGIFNQNKIKDRFHKEHYSKDYKIIGESVNGVQSEYFRCDVENVYPMPENIDYCEAASMPLVFMTAYEMLIKRAKIKKNDKVLIYGASSGVGSAAIQIAKDIGCTIYSTVGDEKKKSFALELGCDYVFNHRKSSFQFELKNILKKEKLDIIFEHIGKATWNTSLRFLGYGGRLVTCGATTGYDVSIDLRHLFFKNQSILGSTMGSLDSFEKVIKNISKNKYRPIIDSVFKFKDIKKAHERVENGLNLGKVVLSI